MTKHLDHEKIAADLRAASPHWVEIDSSLTRSGVAGRAQRWNDPRRRPAALNGPGFIFRTRREPATVAFMGQPALNSRAGLFILEGRYLESAIAPY